MTSLSSPSTGVWHTPLPAHRQLAPGGSAGGWQDRLGWPRTMGSPSPRGAQGSCSSTAERGSQPGPMSGHPALAAASRQVSTSFLGAKQRWLMCLWGSQVPVSLQQQRPFLSSRQPLSLPHSQWAAKKGKGAPGSGLHLWQGSRLATQTCQLAQEMPEQTGRSRQPHASLGESFPAFSVLLPHVFVS